MEDNGKKALKHPLWHNVSPLRLLLITAASIFASEALVMVILSFLPELPVIHEALLDSFILTVFVFPLLYLFLFRPLITQIARRTEAEEELRKSYLEMELKVRERTRELRDTNEKLRSEILERKLAEEAVKESETRYRLMHSTAFDGIIIADKAGAIIECNPSAGKIFGYGHGELIGKALLSLMPEHFRGRHLAGFKRFIDTGRSNVQGMVMELEGLRKNGEVFPIEVLVSSFIVRGDLFFSGTVRDITERKLAEDALKKSEAGLREAQRIAHLGNWEWDILRKELRWSDEVYRIFGLTPENFTPAFDAFLESVHPDDREGVFKSVNDALYGGKPYNIYHRIVLPDGGERVVNAQAQVTLNEEGRPVRLTGTLHDVTEAKRMEEEVLRAHKLESIGVLAGGIAHDFNNILTAVMGNIFIVREFGSLDEKMKKRLAEAEKAVELAERLTNQLLTFSKGGSPVKNTASISELINNTAAFALRGSKVKCVYSVPAGLWPVEVDEGQMSQAVNNLIMNAAEAMPEGGIIDIGYENVTVTEEDPLPLREGGYVKVSIRDHGVGIPQENLTRIFDPYFTTKETGSGLGLATVYSIVKRHGGLITVESEAGSGTTFHIYLPASTAPSPVKEAEGELLRKGGSGRVLVMDDEEMIRDIVGEILSEVGYEVSLAADGAEAVELYKKAFSSGAPFDAVIMDLTVPGGMGGKEAIGELLKIDPKVKAIVSSGYSNDPVMSDYSRYGFKDVVVKPYNPQKLGYAVRRLTEGRG